MAIAPPDAPLFDAFPPTDTTAWEARIADDLKGADYRDRLGWSLAEGVTLRPFYRADDHAALDLPDAPPGVFPYLRGTEATGQPGRIRQDIMVDDADAARRAADDARARGAEAVGFVFARLPETTDLARLLDGFPGGDAFHLVGGAEAAGLFARWQATAPGVRPATLDLDPLADLDTAARLLHAAADAPDLRLFQVDARQADDAGADATQTLGFTLAAASEILAAMTERGFEAGAVARRMHLVVPLGTAYFVEIAKLRALRMLFARMVGAYAPGDDGAAKAYVQAVTGWRPWTVYDAHVNLLRGTTMAAAALIGGCDTLTVRPFDAVRGASTAQAHRLARNTGLILKAEAYLGRVADPAAGSYYLDHLTDQLAQAAWGLFQSVEAAGGWRAAMASGMIPQALAETRAARAARFATREAVLVGTNQYPNLDERALDTLGTDTPPTSAARDAAPFEALRLRTERHAATTGAAPSIFLLPIGPPVWRAARASFARNFFGVAGFPLIEPLGFETAEAGAQAAAASGAAVVVVCSADAAYPTVVPAVLAALGAEGAAPLVVVAGAPGDDEAALREAGVHAFIHLKTPLLATLQAFQDRLLTP